MNQRRDGVEIASDEQLLGDFVAGSDVAFTVLVERYGPDLYQFVARFVRVSAVAEDVVQETFLQVYRSAEGFDPARRFRPWLFTIAANKARDHIRGRTRKKEVSLSTSSATDDGDGVSYLDFLSDDGGTPTDGLEAVESRDAVRAVVSQMPDNLREVLIMAYYQQFPYKEIAEILSVPLGTVKSRLHAAVSYFGTAYKRIEEEKTGKAME